MEISRFSETTGSPSWSATSEENRAFPNVSPPDLTDGVPPSRVADVSPSDDATVAVLNLPRRVPASDYKACRDCAHKRRWRSACRAGCYQWANDVEADSLLCIHFHPSSAAVLRMRDAHLRVLRGEG